MGGGARNVTSTKGQLTKNGYVSLFLSVCSHEESYFLSCFLHDFKLNEQLNETIFYKNNTFYLIISTINIYILDQYHLIEPIRA